MIQSFSSETKSSLIARQIEELILNKVYAAGDILPSQQELAETFNASSRSIREAFKQLEAKGLLEVSQGKRAVVKSNNLDQFVASLSSTLISKHTTDK
ncbi:MAG TPA: FadR family transcriptional regulator, partial [Spirochaetales bacterium]|nr:FadR family transcriptional regulator [Spirochaetales bacterium]